MSSYLNIILLWNVFLSESRPISTQGSSRNPAPFGTIITTSQQSLPHSEDLVDVGRLSSAELERQQFEQEEDEWYFGDRSEGKYHL